MIGPSGTFQSPKSADEERITTSIDVWVCPYCAREESLRDHGESGESTIIECGECGKESNVSTSIQYTSIGLS